MQINHNISAMVTQHALYQNNNSLGKSLEKLSTGLRINRAQDDAAGLAMSEQMRSQIRGLGKAKQNAQDGICALQIAEGALAEITNMMQRQKELAVQAANDTLTSTERIYLDDEFQALTKEMDRIAKTTDYNGKNVLIFDQDPNLSFGATKLNPYNREVSFMESSKTLYDSFGSKLSGGLGLVGGDSMSSTDIKGAESDLSISSNNLSIAQASYDEIREYHRNMKPGTDLDYAGSTINFAAGYTVAIPAGTDNDAARGMVQALLANPGGAAYAALNTAKTLVSADKTALSAAKAPLEEEIKKINDAIAAVNKVITDLNGIPLSENNIEEVLRKILNVGDVIVNISISGGVPNPNNPDPALTFGGDKVFEDVKNVFSVQFTEDIFFEVEGSDAQAIKNFNSFLRDVRDAYDAYQAAQIADPMYGDDGDILKGAQRAMQDTLNKIFSSDNGNILTPATVSGGVSTPASINDMTTGAGNYNMLANTANMIIERLNRLADGGGYTAPTGPLENSGIANLGAIFGRTASPQVRDAVATIMQFDVDKMTNSLGDSLPWDNADKQLALALQKTISELSEAYNNYADELACPVGTAASEILHITPNYSNSLGGKEASEIFVNYVEINVKNLGLHVQSVTEQANATRSIDRLDDVIKIVSGNRASIGTYINRLEYTINNICSMEYNTQDAESRIRDTDFSKETTDFTRNQIMVQSATSILAQANNIPQMVLSLLG